jgi:hypothetical protein
MRLPASSCNGWRATATSATAGHLQQLRTPAVCSLQLFQAGVQQQGAQYLWAEEGTCARGFSNVSSLAARVCAGVVKSTKMTRTIVVRRDYLHYIKKYARCEHIPTSDPQMLKSAITVGGCAGGHLLAAKVVLIRH